MSDQPLVPQQPAKPQVTYLPEVISGEVNAKVYKFSPRVRKFIWKMIELGSVGIASAEVGISRWTGMRYLKRKEIKEFIESKWREKALAAGTTMDNHIAWLREKRDTADTDVAIRAARQITTLLKPAGGGIHINMTQNNSAPSPYDKMSPEQLADAMRERLPVIDAIEIRGNSQAPSGG